MDESPVYDLRVAIGVVRKAPVELCIASFWTGSKVCRSDGLAAA